MVDFVAACVQLNSGNNVENNIQKASILVKRAINREARFIALPENVFLMSASPEEAAANADYMESHKGVLAMQKLAAEHQVWILIGSVALKKGEKPADNGIKVLGQEIPSGKLVNRSILINSQGQIESYYDKIHLFDVTVAGDRPYMESEMIEPGDKAVVANLPWAKLGMTICYDLRFPHLFRKLAHIGASIITVPAAFTFKTGEAHWHCLLKARAIETSSYILAPAQCGIHPRERVTYGHSMIIDPWGKVITEASEDDETVIFANIDINQVAEIREKFPSLKHDRYFN